MTTFGEGQRSPAISSRTLSVSSDPTPQDSPTPNEHARDPEKGLAASARGELQPDGDGIVYEYLTFEEAHIHPSEIPASASPSPSPSTHVRPPPPNLTQYGDPLAWPTARKTVHLWLCCAGTLIAAYTPGAYSAGTEQMMAAFGQSRLAIYAGVTVFTGCFAIAPMVLAPFSELTGRKPLFSATGAVFVLCQLGAGLSQSFAGMMVSRAFGGMAASTFSSMVGGVLSDIYVTRERNTPMVFFSAAAMAGTGLGPAIAGIQAQYQSWRWIWYLQTITCGVTVLAQFMFFGETRGSVLLSRKAAKLNAWYDALEAAGYPSLTYTTEKGEVARKRWKVKADEERASILAMIKISLFRPFHLLLTESIVFWFSLWISFAWMLLYLTLGGAVPLIFTTNHGFDSQANGLVFFSLVVGSLLFTPICIYQDKIGRRSGRLDFSVSESHLYFACIQSVLFPIGLFWLAWTQFSYIHYMVPIVALAVMTAGIFSVYLAVFNYLADTYQTYASSAIAAQSFCRNMLGATIPLYADVMLTKMTFQGGLSFLGGIGVLLSFVPWVLVLYGPKIRARSKIACQLGVEAAS